MRFEELLRKERREGHSEGYESGEADMLSNLSDRTFLQEMYRKYQL